MNQITASALLSRKRLVLLLGCVLACLAVVAPVWWLSSIYNRRVAELGGNGDEVAFYPDIFWPLLAAGFVFVVVCAWIVLRPATTLDRVRAWLVIAFVALGGVIVMATTVENWSDPKPKLVLTRDELRCGNRFRWVDISDLTFLSSRRSAAVRFQRQDAASRSRNEFISSCSIYGLTVPPADIYTLIEQRWQAAQQMR